MYTLFFLLLCSCGNTGAGESLPVGEDTASSASAPEDDQNVTVEQKYVVAISEYLKRYPVIASDTLFVGRHPEFPGIELPNAIQGANVRLVNGEGAATYFAKRSNIRYLNVMAWIGEGSSEFLVVTFLDFKPQHNMHLFFRQRGSDFALDSMGMEYPYGKNRPGAYSGR